MFTFLSYSAFMRKHVDLDVDNPFTPHVSSLAP
jgi:hypothetical protein